MVSLPNKLLKAVTALFLLLVATASLNAQHACIPTGPGPEDMVLDTLSYPSARLIVSCNARRPSEEPFAGFQSINLEDLRVVDFVRINEPDQLSLHPHGIDMVQFAGGQLILAVVNHSKDPKLHEILTYEIKGDTLIFLSQFRHPLLISPNDVAIDREGTFYVSNDRGSKTGFGKFFELLFAIRKCRVVVCKNNDCFKTDIKTAYGNGIRVIGNELWVAATFRKDLIKAEIHQNEIKITEKYKIGKGLDNIDFIGDSILLIPAHTQFGKFIKHYKNSEKKSPGVVYAFNKNTGKTVELLRQDGSLISANTTSVHHNGFLYTGQVFDPYILKSEMPDSLIRDLFADESD